MLKNGNARPVNTGVFFSILLLLPALICLAACSGASKRLLADDPQVRAMALDEVLRSGEKVRVKAAVRMKRVLARKDSPYRLYAASALEDLGQSAAPAVPELVAALTDSDTNISFSAERTLARLDAAAPALAEALKSKDPQLRAAAARILPAHGANAAAGLAKELESTDPALAEEAARILAQIGPAAKEAVPALARAAFSGGKDLKTSASTALVKIGPPAGKWLAAALKAPEPKIRAGAAQVLADMRPPAPEAAAALTAALNDPDARIRACAAQALAGYPPEVHALFPENFISALFRAAQAPDEPTRNWASVTLVKVGAPAGKWLAAALKAPDPAARAGAARVITAMFPPPREAAEAALAALSDREPQVRLAAAGALGNYAAKLPASLPGTAALELAGALKAKDPALRSAVTLPLGRLAAGNAEAIAALAAALEDRDLAVRKGAAEALGVLGPAAWKAIPVLRRNLRSRDCVLRRLSARALSQIKPAFKRTPEAAKALGGQCAAMQPAVRPIPAKAAAEALAVPPTAQLLLPGPGELLKAATGQTRSAP